MNSAPMNAPLMLVIPPTIAPTRKSNDFVIWNDSGLIGVHDREQPAEAREPRWW